MNNLYNIASLNEDGNIIPVYFTKSRISKLESDEVYILAMILNQMHGVKMKICRITEVERAVSLLHNFLSSPP